MSSNPAIDANETMAKLLALENRTGYRMQQFNGQRKFWNPKWDKPTPPRGCEVFVGKIPRNLFEDELVPVFEKIGQIYELRLMMDFSGYNRGYAFVCFTCREHAQLAINRLDNYEIRPGMRIGVCRSVDNCRLFVGGIPKDKSQLEIRQAMCEISEDVSDVIVYAGTVPGDLNRGFSFVEYRTHRAAAMARRKLIPGRITLFGNEIVTDWAEPEVDVNESLSRIKNVYVRNLKLTTSEHTVFAAFNVLRPGAIEKVKKIEDRDYAFVHFLHREDALYAVQMMNGQKIDGQEVQVSLAKPPSNKHDTTNAHLLPLNQSNNVMQSPQTFGRINGVMMTRPTTTSQIQNNPLLQQYAVPTSSNYSDLIRASLASIQPPSFPSSYPAPSPSFANPTASSLLSGPNGDGLLNSMSKQFDCICNGKQTALLDHNQLIPVSTLDHIAKIQCPVVYLDEISTRCNNGIRPIYELFCDNSQGASRYVYRITFMGERYTPPTNLYSNDVSEARKIAAEFVIKQIDPWLKKKVSELVVNSNTAKSCQLPDSGQVTKPAASYNGNSLWSSNNNNNNASNYAITNQTGISQSALKKSLYSVPSRLLSNMTTSSSNMLNSFTSSTANGLLGNYIPTTAGLLNSFTSSAAKTSRSNYTSATPGLLSNFTTSNTTGLLSNLTPAVVSTSPGYGLGGHLWNQVKSTYSSTSAKQSNSPNFSGLSFNDTMYSPVFSDALNGLKRQLPSLNRVSSPCAGLQTLTID